MNAKINFSDNIDISSKDGLAILRHSISHVMAQAVQDVFKGAKVSIGPSIDDGFYYDFDYKETFTTEDFVKIEKRMREIIAADYPFIREELSRAAAVKLFEKKGENYKVELVNDLPAEVKVVSAGCKDLDALVPSICDIQVSLRVESQADWFFKLANI